VDLDTYQRKAHATADYDGCDAAPGRLLPHYPVMGLGGEVGEVLEKAKKVLRDDDDRLSPDTVAALRLELGDALWNLTELCGQIDLPLSSVAAANLAEVEAARPHVPTGGDAATFGGYQVRAHATAAYPGCDTAPGQVLPRCPAMGLGGAAGKVMDTAELVLRNGDQLESAHVDALARLLGQVLWYLAELCTQAGLSLSEVAHANLAKLASRASRGVLAGSGDLR
jgi:NTP pyrophosphatase (non-canonical NTP hydrolase)